MVQCFQRLSVIQWFLCLFILESPHQIQAATLFAEGRETIFLQPILSPPPDIIHDLKPRVVTRKCLIRAE